MLTDAPANTVSKVRNGPSGAYVIRWARWSTSSVGRFMNVPGDYMLRSIYRRTTGFSELEQVTQRKSEQLIEGFACNPLLRRVFIEARNAL